METKKRHVRPRVLKSEYDELQEKYNSILKQERRLIVICLIVSCLNLVVHVFNLLS